LKGHILAYTLRLYLPLFLIGTAAGVVHLVGRRSRDPLRRRLFDIVWILILLAGAPLWLFLAAAMGWI